MEANPTGHGMAEARNGLRTSDLAPREVRLLFARAMRAVVFSSEPFSDS